MAPVFNSAGGLVSHWRLGLELLFESQGMIVLRAGFCP